jgi:hypothetical protein
MKNCDTTVFRISCRQLLLILSHELLNSKWTPVLIFVWTLLKTPHVIYKNPQQLLHLRNTDCTKTDQNHVCQFYIDVNWDFWNHKMLCIKSHDSSFSTKYWLHEKQIKTNWNLYIKRLCFQQLQVTSMQMWSWFFVQSVFRTGMGFYI